MWDLIVSVPDHCLSFYFDRYAEFDRNLLDLSDSKTVRSAGICFETCLSNRNQHLPG